MDMLGVREPAVYGNTSFDDFMKRLRSLYPHIGFDFFQSNHEGAIIDRLHADGFNGRYAGIILNAGAYTHTSLAIADAIAAIETPVVEVHISNVAAREEIRHRSLIAPVCRGSIAGFGLDSYRLAVEAIARPE